MSEKTQAEINALGFASTARELQENFRQVEEIMSDFAKSYENMDLDPFNLSQAYAEWFAAVSKDPQKLMQDSLAFWQNSLQLSQQAMMSFMGVQSDEVVQAPKGDRRFKHDDWNEKPVYSAIKQSYLLTSQWMRNMVSDVEGLDEHTAEKVKFFTERYLDAMSPTNFALTNPAVMEKVAETKGANLVHGLKNMLTDLEDGKGQLRIRMTDTEAFELGKNVAVTPGKVVFQNRMLQLIQYTPSTDKVQKEPVMIVPPWINKFYILDLQEKNSLLKWLVDQGHTVFVVSWVNPDESYADTSFGDYVTDGVMQAVEAVQYATGEDKINAIGYCIGGTLLATTLAYMKKIGDERIQSATFFTTMLDFADPGELGVFIDEGQVESLEKKMGSDGYLEGGSMAGAFNLLRANDLIWSFYVNNYLLGNDPRPFDLLYWNSDSTRMPAAMHSWYLRNLYLDNKLCQSNAIKLNDQQIDLRDIDVPVCFVSTIEDHIAPWKSTYSGARLFGGEVKFILGGSGHIAGIVNPPAANKYGYRMNESLPESPDEWFENAEAHEGSWWTEWDRWVKAMSNGNAVTARMPGDAALAVIEDAPGTYVKCKMDEQVPVLEYTDLSALKKPGKAKAAPKVSKAATKVAAEVAANDDLTVINGIGPKVAQVLNQEGISSYAQLAKMKPEQIRELLVKADKRNQRFDPSNWPAEAKKLK